MNKQDISLNEQGLFDIYGAVHVPFWQNKFFYSIALGVGLLLLGICLCVAFKKYKNRKKVLLPWDQALNTFSRLKRENIATVAEGAQFYSVLTQALKKYVHQRYGENPEMLELALARTDQEFIQFIEKINIEVTSLDALRAIFMGSLVVKFGNTNAIQEQIEKDLALAISFVQHTQPSKQK